jgi:hypothetical protein
MRPTRQCCRAHPSLGQIKLAIQVQWPEKRRVAGAVASTSAVFQPAKHPGGLVAKGMRATYATRNHRDPGRRSAARRLNASSQRRDQPRLPAGRTNGSHHAVSPVAAVRCPENSSTSMRTRRFRNLPAAPLPMCRCGVSGPRVTSDEVSSEIRNPQLRGFRRKFLHDLALFAQAPMLRPPGKFDQQSGSACRFNINWSLLDAPCCPVPQPE